MEKQIFFTRNVAAAVLCQECEHAPRDIQGSKSVSIGMKLRSLGSKESSIAVMALLGIAIHLIARRLVGAAPTLWLTPLYVVVAVGDVSLLFDLGRRVAALEFGSGLLAGISIVVSVLPGEYFRGRWHQRRARHASRHCGACLSTSQRHHSSDTSAMIEQSAKVTRMGLIAPTRSAMAIGLKFGWNCKCEGHA